MIEAFSLQTAHLFGDALASQARLRYRTFVEHRALEHNHFEGLEYDEFDTPAAVYLVWRDAGSIVRGLIRLLPTTRPFMLQQYWPYLVTSGRTPTSSGIWEITRVCVDKTIADRSRLRILPELLCGVEEYFRLNQIKAMIGVARPHLITHFIRGGIRWLGPISEVEGKQEQAFMVPVEHIRPTEHCTKLNISGSVLSIGRPPDERLVA